MALGSAVVTAALANYETAPLRPAARAVLRLLEKADRTPDEVTPRDIQAVRDAGASDEAIRDALHVLGVFGVLVRLADALGWRLPERAATERVAKVLLARGYAFPPPLVWAARVAGLRS